MLGALLAVACRRRRAAAGVRRQVARAVLCALPFALLIALVNPLVCATA